MLCNSQKKLPGLFLYGLEQFKRARLVTFKLSFFWATLILVEIRMIQIAFLFSEWISKDCQVMFLKFGEFPSRIKFAAVVTNALSYFLSWQCIASFVVEYIIIVLHTNLAELNSGNWHHDKCSTVQMTRNGKVLKCKIASIRGMGLR